MTYKIIRDALGDVVCYGPNDSNYDPAVKSGETLTIEDAIPSPSQKDIDKAASQAAKNALKALDVESIRSMREYIASLANAPQALKDFETQAVIERGKIA